MGRALSRLITLLRYRFFLFAGFLPYILGSILGAKTAGKFSENFFLIGLMGLLFVLISVESFNEYFDWREGGDIFSQESKPPPKFTLPLGIISLIFAGLVAIYFSFNLSPLIWLFAIPGFLAIAFYVGPPIKWAYRGLGEVVISLSYGPGLILGSFFLQTKTVSSKALLISLIVGLVMFSLAVANKIPDFYQDRLTGKRNLVVRLGKGKALLIHKGALFLSFVLIGMGIIFKLLPITLLLSFLLLPLAFKWVDIHQPPSMISAIRSTILIYLALLTIMLFSF